MTIPEEPALPTTRPDRPTVQEPTRPPAGPETGEASPVQFPAHWTFGDRQFTQGELSIEGEALIVGLAARILDALGEQGIASAQLGALVASDGSVDLAVAARLVTTISSQIPQVAGEALAILFGNYPTDLEDQPNPEFVPTARYLARNVPSPRVFDVLAAFVAQNDYARLSGPFGALAARLGVELPALLTPGGPGEGSPDSQLPATEPPAKSSAGSRSGKQSGSST